MNGVKGATHRVIALALPIKMSALQSALSAAWLADETGEKAQTNNSAASSTDTTGTNAQASVAARTMTTAGSDSQSTASELYVSEPQATSGLLSPSDEEQGEDREGENGLRFIPLENPFGSSHSWDSPLMPHEVDACRSEHVGVVDSFAPIVWAEFTMLVTHAALKTQSSLWYSAKVLAHVPLFLACFLAPWRLVELLVALFEPRRRWPARKLRRLVGRLERAEGALALYRSQLLPFCNRAAKQAVDRTGSVRIGDSVEMKQRRAAAGEAVIAGKVTGVNYGTGSCHVQPLRSELRLQRDVALRDTWRVGDQANNSEHGSISSSERESFLLPKFCAQWLAGAETEELAWLREELAELAMKAAKLVSEEDDFGNEVQQVSTFRKLLQGFATALTAYIAASDMRLRVEGTKLMTQVCKHTRACCLACCASALGHDFLLVFLNSITAFMSN